MTLFADDPALAALAFGGVAALASLLALAGLRANADFTRANAALFAAFAAGLIVSMALLHLIPHALEGGERAPWLVLAGFTLGFVLQRVIEAGAHGRAPGLAFALAPVLAIAVHSMLDGLVYAVTFAIDPFTGVTAVTGLVVHEIPEAIVCFVLLQRAGLSDRAAVISAFVATGLTTFAAAAGGSTVASDLEPGVLYGLFAVTAGLLLNIGSSHLLAHAGEAGWLRATPALLVGGLAAAAMTLIGHGHPHPEPAGHEHDHAGHEHDHAHLARDDEARPRFDRPPYDGARETAEPPPHRP